MLIDLSGLSSFPFVDKNYDVAIAGAGPAGITLALEFAKAGKKVALFEGGGLTYDQKSQGLYTLVDDTDNYFSYTRLRYFGGTSNHWAGRCRLPEPIDFEERSEIYEESGWPISLEELNQYLDPAKELLELNGTFAGKPGTQDLPESFYPDPEQLSSPTRFGQKYLETIKASDAIDLYINANLVDIRLDDDLKTISGFVIRNYEGVQANASAQQFIVALGAVENARVLLNCDSQVSGGLGNGGDMLGRCFMEHFNVRLGKFIPLGDAWDGVDSMAFYTSEEFVRESKIGSSNVTMHFSASAEVDGRGKAVKNFLVERACSWGMEDQLSKLFQFKCPDEGRLSSLTEQDPAKRNRIYLSQEVDDIGLRKAQIDWYLSDFDKKTIKAVAEEFAVQCLDGDLARVKVPDFLFEESVKLPFYGNGYQVHGHAHHMGGTRMALTEKDGVVDTNCKVFGTENLFVAGSSIFPRGGAHNPTLPLLQLALRLSEHMLNKV
ncbi:GMC oxidoreductase [Sessilibacter sp. MAH2]